MQKTLQKQIHHASTCLKDAAPSVFGTATRCQACSAYPPKLMGDVANENHSMDARTMHEQPQPSQPAPCTSPHPGYMLLTEKTRAATKHDKCFRHAAQRSCSDGADGLSCAATENIYTPFPHTPGDTARTLHTLAAKALPAWVSLSRVEGHGNG